MDKDQVQWLLALTMVPGIGPIHARNLVAHTGNPESVFKSSISSLCKIPGVSFRLAKAILGSNPFPNVEKELAFMKIKGIEAISFWDKDFPQRLKHCPDAPVLLFYKGNASLNHDRIVAIVGTRHATTYGKQITEEIVQGLAQYNVLMVSGLAYGIDITAHRASLDNGLPTVGVVAHGLDRIYPELHTKTAHQMMDNGGVLTEFLPGNEPDKQNFPKRNRIVAGMADAVLVTETTDHGGAVITATLANGYNRDVFAVPGDVNRKFSSGCNKLIKNHKAILVENAADLAKSMNWDQSENNKRKTQRELFIELNAEEKLVLKVLHEQGELHIDKLTGLTGLSPGSLAGTLLSLEFQSLILALPGKRYRHA